MPFTIERPVIDGEALVVDITQIGAAFGALKATKDIAEAMIGLSNAEAIRGKVFDIQSKLLDAQTAMFAVNEERATLIERVGKLENEIMQMKTWDVEKKRYQLREAPKGIFIYTLKREEQGVEPAHDLCANCYQGGKKSILQGARRAATAGPEALICPNGCPPLKYTRGDLPPPTPRTAAKNTWL